MNSVGMILCVALCFLALAAAHPVGFYGDGWGHGDGCGCGGGCYDNCDVGCGGYGGWHGGWDSGCLGSWELKKALKKQQLKLKLLSKYGGCYNLGGDCCY